MSQDTSNDQALYLTARKLIHSSFGEELGCCPFHSLPGDSPVSWAFLLKKPKVRISPHEHYVKGSKGIRQEGHLRDYTDKTG